ncbi:hypothetical protein D623_10010575 [Myotis brandtii]|uniref:Uncharacterized protein n=1 Tax=Myotis brandtii TaxID=109478 RepID=S7QCX8_MYOBR|nr:hypothetical protein D623_10010575 [Myotis brandtii]
MRGGTGEKGRTQNAAGEPGEGCVPQSPPSVIGDFLSDWRYPTAKAVHSRGACGTHKRMRCSLAGQEGIREDFLEEAGIPGGSQ